MKICVCKEQGLNTEWVCPKHGYRWRKHPDGVTFPLEKPFLMDDVVDESNTITPEQRQAILV